MKLKTILLHRLRKENQWAKDFSSFEESLIVLCVTTGSISIATFATVIGAPVGILSASWILEFSITTGIVKETIKNNKK